jgi:3-dehydroquinate synthase
LNYGHTVGHGLERVIGFGQIRHGEAVAWGMEVAARISVLSNSCPPEVADFQHQLLLECGLLGQPSRLAHPEIMAAILHDKKSVDREPRWVLLRELGRGEHGRSVPPAIVEAALREVLG